MVSKLRVNEVEDLAGNPLWRSGEGILGNVTTSTGTQTLAESLDSRVFMQGIISVTVGATGDYSTINNALKALNNMRYDYVSIGSRAVITLLSGFVMEEQVIVTGGQDFSWIDILAEDAITTIDKASITEAMVPIDGARPAFGARDNSKLPRIGCKFEYSDNIDSWDGVAVFWGSSASFLPESGIRNCRRGIQAYYHSNVYCFMDGLRSGGALAAGDVRGVDFRNTAGRGLDVQYGSTANLARSNFEDAGSDAVYVLWNSNADLFQSTMARAGATAVLSRDGSTVDARECNVSDAGDRAFHALHNSRINARSRNPSAMNPWVGDGAARCLGTIAILASYNSFIDCAEINVADASSRGIHASDASKICARNVIATNCGTFAIHAAGASEIDALAADVSGSEIGLLAQNGSTVNGQDVIGNNCDFGVSCTSASRVNANNGSFTSSGSTGMQAIGASSIEASGSDVTGSPMGMLADQGSTINGQMSTIDNCDRAVEARNGCKINVRQASIDGSITRAISCIDGGEIDLASSTGTVSSGMGITVRAGGICKARNVPFDIDLRDGGGIVFNSLGTGTIRGVSGPNVTEANGTVYR